MLGIQSKMARAALSLGVRDLAGASGVSADTIVRLEKGEILQARTLAAIRAALEAAGIIFIPENGGGAGVRLRRPAIQVGTATPPPFAETIAAALDTLPAKAEEAANALDPAPGATQKDQ